MKRLLFVSLVAICSVMNAGFAAIPDKNYVDANLDSKVGKTSVVDIDNAEDLMSADNVDELKGKVVGADAFVGVSQFMTMIYNTAITGDSEEILDLMAGDGGDNVVPNLKTPSRSSVVAGINSVYDVVKTNQTNIGNKVDKTDVAEKGETVADANSDKMVPTVARMDDAISTAVSAGVKSVDLSSRVPVAQGESNKNAVMITDEQGNVVASTEVADFLESIPGELDNRVKIEQGEDKKNQIMITDSAGYVATTAQLSMDQIMDLSTELNGKIGTNDIHGADLSSNTVEILDNQDYGEADAQVPSYAWALKQANQVNTVIGGNAAVVDLDSLNTVNKTSLVAAINEVNGNIAAVAKKGDSVTEELADDQVPTVAHMKEAISDATEGIDLSAKLDVANVVTENEQVDDDQANSVVPSYKRMQDEISRAVVLDEGAELNVYAQDVQGNPQMSAPSSDVNIPSVNAVAKNFLPVPTGECANKANKCALVTGVDENNDLIYSWEVIARNINASEATE